jgi:hypothetical protein
MRSKPLCNILVVIALTLSLTNCGSGQFATEQTSEIQTDSYENSEPTQELDTGLEIPLEEVDYNSLPQGFLGSTAYDIGAQQAEEFIYTSALTRALYDTLGGLEQSCRVVLESFMAYQGGSSTLQQYADFLYGCETVVRDWY